MGLEGLALALALTTFARARRAAGRGSRGGRSCSPPPGWAGSSAVVASVAAVAFARSPRPCSADVAAAVVGLVLYAALLALVLPLGLREAWVYVRALGTPEAA